MGKVKLALFIQRTEYGTNPKMSFWLCIKSNKGDG